MTDRGASGVSPSLHADAPFQAGAAAFAQGRYFAAHEHWERAWLQRQGEEKVFLAALIQAAAGLLKREQGRDRGARRLLQRARARLAGTAIESPIDVPRLLRRIDAELAGIDRGETPLPPEPILRSARK